MNLVNIFQVGRGYTTPTGIDFSAHEQLTYGFTDSMSDKTGRARGHVNSRIPQNLVHQSGPQGFRLTPWSWTGGVWEQRSGG